MTPAHVVEAARSHLGTPWMHQGRLPGVALDCAGLVIVVARQLCLIPQDWDINGYERTPDGTMLHWCDTMMTRADEPAPGRVIVLTIRGDPQHLGIVGNYRHGGLSVIHAASQAGKVVETRLMFARNFVLRGVYTMPGVR